MEGGTGTATAANPLGAAFSDNAYSIIPDGVVVGNTSADFFVGFTDALWNQAKFPNRLFTSFLLEGAVVSGGTWTIAADMDTSQPNVNELGGFGGGGNGLTLRSFTPTANQSTSITTTYYKYRRNGAWNTGTSFSTDYPLEVLTHVLRWHVTTFTTPSDCEFRMWGGDTALQVPGPPPAVVGTVEALARDETKKRLAAGERVTYDTVLAAMLGRSKTTARLYDELASAQEEIDDLKAMLHDQRSRETEPRRGVASMRDAKENATEMRDLRLAPTAIGERSQGPFVLRSGLDSEDDWRSVSSVRSTRVERKA
jgi:hypothetical protein